MLKVKNSIHNPLIITGDYQVERFTNAIIIEAQSNCTITLPPLDNTLIGYFLWIKRKDNNNFVVTVAAAAGNDIEGLASINLSPHQSMGVLGFNETLWRYFSKDRFTTVTEADLATIAPTEIGTIIFNTNPGFMFGVGLYYADGVAWNSTGSGPVNVIAPIKVNPLTLMGGTSRDIIQWQASSSEWLYRDSLVGNIVYVDEGGDDATAELNNPFRPFATIIAAKNALVTAAISGTVYVRPGTYTVDNNLIAPGISYYFSPRCSVICSVTPFFWSGANPVLDEFYCYGYGDFSAGANSANVVSLTGNVTNFVLYASSAISSVNDAIRIDNITNCYINIRGLIQSTISNGMTLERITRGVIYAGDIAGIVRGIDFPTSSVSWYINCFSISAVTANAIRSQGVGLNNIFIDCINISSMLSIGVIITNGNVTIRAKNIESISGTFALDQIDGTCTVTGFNALTGSPPTSSAVRVRGNARMALIGNTITGIVISGGTPTLNVNINRLLKPSVLGGSNFTITNITTGGTATITANTVIGGNGGFLFLNNSASLVTMNIIINYIDTLGASTILTNTGVGSFCYMKLGRIPPTNMPAFNMTGGTNFIEFDSIRTITNNVAIFTVDGADTNVWIKGRLAEAEVGNCLRVNSAAAGIINWQVNNTISSGGSPFSLDITSNPTINIWDTYARCSANSIIGHVASVTGAGTPIIRLFNCVGTKTNATAKIFSSVNPINVLVYSTFTSNDTSTNTTYLVGNNLVSALVV